MRTPGISSTALLVQRGLRQAPLQAVATVLLSALSAALIGIGVLNSAQFPAAFEQRLDALHAADVVIMPGDEAAANTAGRMLQADPRVQTVDRESLLNFFAEVVRDSEGGDSPGFAADVYLFDLSTPMAQRSTAIRSEATEIFPDGVYVPQQLHDSRGYQLGDRFELQTSSGIVPLRVQGFLERPFLGSNTFGMFGVAMTATQYAAFTTTHPQVYTPTWLSVTLHQRSDAADVVADLQADLGRSPGYDPANFYSFDRDIYALVSTMPAMITAMLLLSFVVIIIAAVTVTLAYLCAQRLRRDLASIGILKALGYTGGRIRVALLTMFLALAFVGVGLGTAVTYLLAPGLASSYSTRAGFEWNPHFSPLALGICLLVIPGSAVIATLFGTRKAVRYAPVAALRGTLSPHSFARNPLPLEHSRGPIGWLLAAKTAARNSAQLVGMSVVVVLFSFASMFAVAMMDAATNNQRLFNDVITGGIPNLRLTLAEPSLSARTPLVAKLSAIDGVSAAVPSKEITVRDSEGSELDIGIFSDTTAPRYNPVEQGRLPVHENEIAVGLRYAGIAGMNVGDEIEVEYADETRSMLVTATIQGTRSLGMIGMMSEAALHGFDKTAQLTEVSVYAEEGVDAAALLRDIESELADDIASSVNIDLEVGAESATYTSLIVAFAQTVLAITVVVVTLVLWLMVATLLAERRRDFGVMRALGYTWPQLARQVALSYLPPLAVAVTAGVLLGAATFNPIMGLMLRDLGGGNPSFPMRAEQVAMLGGALIALLALLLFALTARIQRISPSELVRD